MAFPTDTIYRALREQFRPRLLHRRDRGNPRKAVARGYGAILRDHRGAEGPHDEQQGPAFVDPASARNLIDHGVETPDGLGAIATEPTDENHGEPISPGLGVDDAILRRPPVAVRFQAEHSNECWQFDASPSDLKQVPAPLWIEEGRGAADA